MPLLRKLLKLLFSLLNHHRFALLTTLCVAIIVGSALWTRSVPVQQLSQATPPVVNQPAAALMQQSLASAATPTPLPTTQPVHWVAPLSEMQVLQPFSLTTMTRSPATGLWTVHAGTDLTAQAGQPVVAMASGRVVDCGSDDIEGTWLSISHSGVYISRYCGLSMLGAARPGDPVSAGQTIGFAGNTHTQETHLGPHLHLEVTLNGEAVDPLSLLP